MTRAQSHNELKIKFQIECLWFVSVLRIQQKRSRCAMDSVTGSTTELSRLTNHPKHHSPVISLRSRDRAKMPVLEGALPPSQVLLITGLLCPSGSEFSYCQVQSFTSVPHLEQCTGAVYPSQQKGLYNSKLRSSCTIWDYVFCSQNPDSASSPGDKCTCFHLLLTPSLLKRTLRTPNNEYTGANSKNVKQVWFCFGVFFRSESAKNPALNTGPSSLSSSSAQQETGAGTGDPFGKGVLGLL